MLIVTLFDRFNYYPYFIDNGAELRGVKALPLVDGESHVIVKYCCVVPPYPFPCSALNSQSISPETHELHPEPPT